MMLFPRSCSPLSLLTVVVLASVSSFTANGFTTSPYYTSSSRSTFVPLSVLKDQKSFSASEVSVETRLEQQKQDVTKNVASNDLDVTELTTTTTTTTTTPVTSVIEWEGLLWRGSVVALCALWASNFAAAKVVMAEPGVDSALYAVSRFSLAAAALLPGAALAVKRGALDWKTARGAAVCGGWVAFGYLGQTLGLLTTTASRSCVICTLHCVFVAIVAETMRVQKAAAAAAAAAQENNTSFDIMRLVPAAVAVAGVAIVELKGAGGAPTIGDALSFAQPIGFGLGYLQLEELMRERPEAALPVSAIKLLVVALASLIFFEVSPWIIGAFGGDGSAAATTDFAFRIPDLAPIFASPSALSGILYTGLITTALALWVESIAFKRVPATDASIILTTEPLFAAAAGAVVLGETFGISDYVGAALICGACALAVLMDDSAHDDQCDLEAAQEGKCEMPRSVPISAE